MSTSQATTNVFFSGVGGQGTILASNLLGQVLLRAGYDVKKAEVHGMAQRGGDVTTHFRFGARVYSPLIRQGEVDILVAFELLEGLRYIDWLRPEARIVLNNHRILPPAVSLGKMEYPPDIAGTFRKHFGENVRLVEGAAIARALGNIQVANVVLLGTLSALFTDPGPEQWLEAIRELLPARHHEINVKAFLEGRGAGGI
ncbi:MAG: indolepyruvate oxidoreductase subunit beta [Acidobacteriota bacterium]|mgnify:FL=1|jgi:indolepyruvate ferredoxin oxidoreductase beta subunit|nr:indolepyruvate oxidoreductase subunit beta [Acidobacteriota bacterium]NLT34175.1 indolepyruvate oxidoreductase subunit beta [Acidobacteriota bacterium]